MNLKKLTALGMTAVMTATLCACGTTAASGSGSAAVSEDGIAAAQEKIQSAETGSYVATYPIVEEPITVTGLVVGADDSVSESRLVWDKVSEITGINIEWINIDEESLATYLASNDWPDFFHTGLLTSSQINDYGIQGGRFVNYLDHLDIMPNLAQTLKDFPEARASSIELNGEMYQLFAVSGISATSTSCRPHYRRDVLEAAGIENPPTTVDELYEDLKILREKNGVPGMILDTSNTTGMVPMLFSAFGTLNNLAFDDDGTGQVVYAPVTEQTRHYYEFLHKLYEEDLMNREWLTMDDSVLDQQAKSGNVAFMTAAAAQRLSLEDLNGDWENLDCLAPLTSEYDQTQTLAGVIDYRNQPGMFINKDSQYVEELCKMFDIAFATEEVVPGSGLYGQTFVWGFEGVDWKMNDDNTYEEIVPEDFSSFSAYQAQALRFKDLGRADAFGTATTSTPGNSQARQKAYAENVIPYQITEHIFPSDPTGGFLKFTDDEQYIIDNKYADIDLYVTEMRAKFISGAADIETEWDTYVETVERMGLEEVLGVYQTAYDRWCEAANS